ncbi:MAG: T9SS type A sorting domain-containing protein [Candidatus Kapabacteria bacterium]|nr:T9SS type A sorting domain-containing protein [Candidatus Kapabacteria bacterium]
MNKTTLSLACFLYIFAATASYAGVNLYSFGYDAAGNRIRRTHASGKIIAPHQDSLTKTIVDVKHDIKVAPNPTTGIASLSISNLSKDESGFVTVVDLNGTAVYTLKSISAANTLDLSTLSNGVFILRVEINGASTSWKIVKQK